jgi:hypothetical protein
LPSEHLGEGLVQATNSLASDYIDIFVKTGGVIRRGELPFVHTQDMNMPKAGQDLTFDFYETPVRPDLKTEVYMKWQGDRSEYCFNTAQFTPKPGHYHEFWMTSGHGRSVDRGLSRAARQGGC